MAIAVSDCQLYNLARPILLLSCLQRTLEGHVGDIYTCRYFPSGIVVLSGGADLRLKIWSVQDGSCPRTLTGHTRGERGAILR